MKAVLIGGGGHAGVLLSVLRTQTEPVADVVGILDADPTLKDRSLHGVKVLGGDELLNDLKAGGIDGFVNGLGRTGKADNRQAGHDRSVAAGLQAVGVVSPHAVVAGDAAVGPGAQILPGAIVNSGAAIGEGAVINTGAIVEHDCRIGAHAFVSPGATLLGGVTIGPGAFVGAGAVILQGLTVGPGAVVGAGAVVLSDVPAGRTAVGVPARELPGGQD